MKRMLTLGAVCVCAIALSACGEKPQTASGKTSDVELFKGTDNGFMASGWKAGDKASWELGLKARMQNSQNEYTKLNSAQK